MENGEERGLRSSFLLVYLGLVYLGLVFLEKFPESFQNPNGHPGRVEVAGSGLISSWEPHPTVKANSVLW